MKMKTLLSVLLVAALIGSIFLTGCTPAADEVVEPAPPVNAVPAPTEPESGVSFTPGTFRGESRGWGSLPIVLDVTFSETHITDIDVLSHSETPGLSDLAFSQVPAQIVEYQTLIVDRVHNFVHEHNDDKNNFIDVVNYSRNVTHPHISRCVSRLPVHIAAEVLHAYFNPPAPSTAMPQLVSI